MPKNWFKTSWLAKQSWSPSIPDKHNWSVNKFSQAIQLRLVGSLMSRDLEAVEDSKLICINPQMKGSSAVNEASKQMFLVWFFGGESMACWHKKQASLMSHQTISNSSMASQSCCLVVKQLGKEDYWYSPQQCWIFRQLAWSNRTGPNSQLLFCYEKWK